MTWTGWWFNQPHIQGHSHSDPEPYRLFRLACDPRISTLLDEWCWAFHEKITSHDKQNSALGHFHLLHRYIENIWGIGSSGRGTRSRGVRSGCDRGNGHHGRSCSCFFLFRVFFLSFPSLSFYLGRRYRSDGRCGGWGEKGNVSRAIQLQGIGNDGQ